MSSYFADQSHEVAVYFEEWHNRFKGNSPELGSSSRYCMLFNAFAEIERKEIVENLNGDQSKSIHN